MDCQQSFGPGRAKQFLDMNEKDAEGRNPARDGAQLFLDLSRLIAAAWRRTPAGIPRVDLAYAQHFIANSPERLQFVACDAVGRLRVVETGLAANFVTDIARFWHDDISSPRAYIRMAWQALYLHLR